jgi:hypothetical protein
MRETFMKFFQILTVLGLFLSAEVYAEKCGVHFETQPVGNYLRKNIEIPVFEGDLAHKTLIDKTIKDITGQGFDGKTFDQAIEQVYSFLHAKPGLKGLEKSEEMAKFAKSLNPIFEDMLAKAPAKGSASAPDFVAWTKRKKVLDKIKTVKYGMARKVSSFEEFAYDEFKVVAKEDIVLTRGDNFTKLTHMKMKDYPKYVDSYLYHLKDPTNPKAALYGNIDEGSLGILKIEDIRDITSYNVWPMYLKSHDIRHIHFSLTHPMALAAMMGTTRSKNHMRYVLMAGLYEGVDRIQYGHESTLNAFFSSEINSDVVFGIKRNMDLEEAMLTISNATDEELKRLAELSSVSVTDGGLFNGISSWSPKRVDGGSVTGKAIDGESFETEIDNMVSQYSHLLDKSEKLKAKLLKNPDLVITAEEEHFMKLMNFQLNPENPEIVIDGLRFKNDGRAHSYGSNQNEINIGIGDQ